jgi:hypothetical protein
MSLMLVAAEAGLPAKIRNRMAEGAAVFEVTAADMPAWLSEAVGNATVEAAFVSAHAGVAVLAGGHTVARRAPR